MAGIGEGQRGRNFCSLGAWIGMELDSLLVDKLAIARELLARASVVSAEPNILGPALGVSLAQDALARISHSPELNG